MEEVHVCNVHNRIQKERDGSWMKMSQNFRHYLFSRNSHRFQEVEIPCDICERQIKGTFPFGCNVTDY